MAEVRLYNSTICRLCAEDNDNGEMLFTDDSEETELSAMVNRYLPVKIQDDGKLPRTICPGCNIQLEATVQFFELLIEGQDKIRKMWKQQMELERKTERGYLLNNSELINESFTIESDDQQIIFNVISDGPLYNAEHNLSLRMEGLEKPKKKRGRPPKCFPEEETQEVEKDVSIESIEQEEENKQDEEEIDGDKRGRRRIKAPKRYMETVQGKELEKIFKDEGVFDEEVHIKYEPFENLNTLSLDSFNSDTEIIGHLITTNGKALNEPIVNKNRIRTNQQKSKVKKKYKFTCSFCGKGFTQRSKYIIHKSLHKTVVFECTDCQNQFSNKEDLLLHQKTTNHTGEKMVGTSIEVQKDTEAIQSQESSETISKNDVAVTNTNFSAVEDSSITAKKDEHNKDFVPGDLDDIKFESIQESNNSGDALKCEKCKKHFDSQTNLESHVKVVHKGEKPYVCEICSKGFAYQTSLQGHIEIEHWSKADGDKSFPCDVCGKLLNHPSSIAYHKLTEHNDGRLYECNKCTKRFKHKQLLQRHQIVHSENRPFPCKSCPAAFKTKANLLNHQSTHTGEKKHCCKFCDTKFAHKTSLTLHYRTHTGQKPYKCGVCTKSFSQNGNLQEHMRIHTGEKPYCCDHCGRKFTTSSQFKLHVKRHTGERPWQCDYCPKSFLHKDTWKCHVRRHTGERPYKCVTCERKFTEQWALKKHLRLHTGEKPYSCEICGKAFADCSNLTKHKKVHKNQQVKMESSEEINATETDNNLWQIVPNPEEETVTLEKIDGVTENEVPEDDMSRVIYVTYQSPNNPNESITLEISKENLIADQALNSNDDTENGDDNDIQFSILDADGNPIRLSAQQARQLLSDGQLLNQVNNDSNHIQSPPAVLQNNGKLEISSNSVQDNAISKTPISSVLPTDAEAIVKILQDENTDATAVAMSQINAEEQQVFELVTPDGRKVQYIKVDPLQLSSGLLTIV